MGFNLQACPFAHYLFCPDTKNVIRVQPGKVGFCIQVSVKRYVLTSWIPQFKPISRLPSELRVLKAKYMGHLQSKTMYLLEFPRWLEPNQTWLPADLTTRDLKILAKYTNGMLNAEDYPGRCWSGSATNTAHKGTRITCPDNLLLIRLSTITLGTSMESASLPLSPQPFETPKSQSTTPPLSRAEPSLVLVPVHQIENCPCQDLTIHGCEHALWAVSSTCLPFLLTRTFLSQLFLRVFRGLRFGLQRLVSLRCCFAFRSYFDLLWWLYFAILSA